MVMNKPDAVLVRPPENIIETWYDYAESLGIGYIATFARAHGFKIKIIDAILEKLSWQDTANSIIEENPLIVGFTLLQVAFENAVKIIRELRKIGYGGHICLGGHFPTFAYEGILKKYKEIDSIVRFEGELPFLDLLKSVKKERDWRAIANIAYYDGNKVIDNPVWPLVRNLDELPFPARDHLGLALETNKTVTISGSRGCWGRCTFCTVTSFYDTPKGSRWRGRSVENILDEISLLQKQYHIHSFTFIDDNFIGPGERGKHRIKKFCRELIRRDLNIEFSFECRADVVEEGLFRLLKSVGLKSVFLGIESGLDDVLIKLGKSVTIIQNISAISILNKLKINIVSGFLMYTPDTTLEELKGNLDFLRKYGTFDFPALIRRVEVRHGMKMMQQLREKKRLSGSELNPYYEFSDNRVKMLYHIMLTTLSWFVPVYFKYSKMKRNNVFKNKFDKIVLDKIKYSALDLVEEIANLILAAGRIESSAMKKLQAMAQKRASHINSFLDVYGETASIL